MIKVTTRGYVFVPRTIASGLIGLLFIIIIAASRKEISAFSEDYENRPFGQKDRICVQNNASDDDAFLLVQKQASKQNSLIERTVFLRLST
jgi:hypothetical protein